MYKAIIRTFNQDIIEWFECHTPRDAYYCGRDSLRFWSNHFKNQFIYLDLPELSCSGCAYTSDFMQTAVIERS